MRKTEPRKLTSLVLAASFSTMLILGAAAQSKGNPMPTDTVRSYAALSDDTTTTLGDALKLSRTSASFSKLAGKMSLRHSGVRNDDKDTEFTGDVYEVLNAEEFFAPNKGKNGFCDKPVRWLIVQDISGTIGQDAIRIGMLSIHDWHQYKPTSLGACSADTFTLERRK